MNQSAIEISHEIKSKLILSDKEKNFLDNFMRLVDRFKIQPFIREQFEFDQHLGTGYQGRVWATKKKNNDKSTESSELVCLKIIEIRRDVDIELTRAELKAYKKLKNKYDIAPEQKNVYFLEKCHEFEINLQKIFIIIELEKGECSLADIFDGNPKKDKLDFTIGIKIFQRMVYILKILIDCKIFHGDLKPQNFLFFKKNEGFIIKLIDYGSSLVMDENNLIDSEKIRIITKEFSPGEVFNKEHSNLSGEKIDVYSLGEVFYRIYDVTFTPNKELANLIECKNFL
jgi:serine/threonine protein kinase